MNETIPEDFHQSLSLNRRISRRKDER